MRIKSVTILAVLRLIGGLFIMALPTTMAGAAAPLPKIKAGGVGVSPEGDTGSRLWKVPVTLSAPSTKTVTVEWSTLDIPTSPTVAHPGNDYVAASGTLTFEPGRTKRIVWIRVLGDIAEEPPLLYGEWGLVALSNPTNATIDTSGLYGLGIFVIIDDDEPCVIGETPVTTVVSQTGCDALVAVYNANGGPHWTNNTGWNTPTDPCDWYGVACDVTGVTDLLLSENGLVASLPAEIGNLTSLDTLELQNNWLNGSIPAEIGSLTNLDTLFLDGNELSGSIPAEIGNLTKLSRLTLTGNGLTGLVPPEFANLASIDYLWLSGNFLSGDITAAMTGIQDTITYVFLGDGPDGNECFTVTDELLAEWLTSKDEIWDECAA